MNTTDTDANADGGGYGPVLFRFDSSQRKNQVIIYDSVRHPGKSSEWFFVRKNATTLNETYRCVQCRSTIEKAGKPPTTQGGEQPLGPGARITVRLCTFVTDPDYPLGEHICELETNASCDTHAVWARRALVRANSELRTNPERPKLKFQKMLQSIRDGEDEYAHLGGDTRELMIQWLMANKGFDSRRRSFARNNSLAVKRLKTHPESLDDTQRRSVYVFANARQKGSTSSIAPINTTYACGLKDCGAPFLVAEERANHRSAAHPQFYFLEEFNNRFGDNWQSEMRVEEYTDTIDPSDGDNEDDTSSLLNVVDDCDVRMVTLEDNEVAVGEYEEVVVCADESQPTCSNEAQHFINAVDETLSKIQAYASGLIVGNTKKKQDFLAQLDSFMYNHCHQQDQRKRPLRKSPPKTRRSKAS